MSNHFNIKLFVTYYSNTKSRCCHMLLVLIFIHQDYSMYISCVSERCYISTYLIVDKYGSVI